MRGALRGVQYALRRLRATPGFTIAATLTLAIAIGATALVFGLVDGVLLKAFPFRDPDRVMALSESSPERHLPQFAVAPANYLDWRAENTVFTALAASQYSHVTVTGAQEPERLGAFAVTPSFFSVLGMTPVLGRGLANDSGGPAEVVVSYGYWERQLGGAPSALGRTLALDNRPYTIVGVLPPAVPTTFDFMTRLSFTAAEQIERGSHTLGVYGRLKPGVTLEAARREMETIAGRLAEAYPGTNKNWSVLIDSLVDRLVGPVRPALIMLLAAAACVLLIGAANLANLFLVRCLARSRELAVRTALGATQRRLVGELLAEAAILGLVATALGVALAFGGVHALRTLAPPTLPRLSEIAVNGRVVAFCVLSSVATVFVFGVLPALQTSRGGVADFLKEGGRGTGSAQHHRFQDVLVVLQVAVALVLLTGAGLLVESFDRFRRMDPGFRPEGVLTAEIGLPPERYPTPERQAAFVASVLEQLAAQPHIEAASASSSVPGKGAPSWGYTIVGEPAPDRGLMPVANVVAASPDYFRTMGITLQAGRGLLPTDDGRAVKVVVVDDLWARQSFGGRDPVGRSLSMGGAIWQIVGVVATVKQRGLALEDGPTLYVPFAQTPDNFADIAVRTSDDPAAAARALKQAVASLDRTVPVSDVETMSERMMQSVGTTRFSSFLASLFAVVALVLGTVGVYSVLTYIVTQRRREIAIRIALGAGPTRVMGSVVQRALVLTSIGIALGSGAAWILTRGLANLFLGVSPHDPRIFAGAAALFAMVALVAASLPAFRTTRINPVVALTSG